MYDLTNVLSTIAGCSASIVAILGGLIASRLIALNTERNEAEDRIAEIEGEIAFYLDERHALQIYLDEDDALDFIRDNVEKLLDGDALDAVYKEEDRPRLQKDVLYPYWRRAEKVRDLLLEDMNSRGFGVEYEKNDDGISVDLAKRLTEDFEYSVCKKILKHLGEKKSPLYATLNYEHNVTGGIWYSKTQDQLNADDNKIDFLELQRKQHKARLAALKRPRGMKSGLILFAMFFLANIIFPLSVLPFRTNDYQSYLVVKTVVIGLFSVGLIAILGYLVYLLHWEPFAK